MLMSNVVIDPDTSNEPVILASPENGKADTPVKFEPSPTYEPENEPEYILLLSTELVICILPCSSGTFVNDWVIKGFIGVVIPSNWLPANEQVVADDPIGVSAFAPEAAVWIKQSTISLLALVLNSIPLPSALS